VRAAALFLVAPAMVAQAPSLSFPQFQAWMKATGVPGYRLMDCQKDGAEYTAAFMGATPERVLMVRCGSLKSFDDVKRMAGAVQGLQDGAHNGLRTRRWSMAGMPMLQIELKKQNCTLGLAGSEGMPMGELDKLAAALKLRD